MQASARRSFIDIIEKCTPQTRAVLSSDAVTIRVPSGLKAAAFTQFVWPLRIAISIAVAVSQMRAVLSRDAVTTSAPSGLKAAERTTYLWARRTTISCAVVASRRARLCRETLLRSARYRG